MSSINWQPFCLFLNVLNEIILIYQIMKLPHRSDWPMRQSCIIFNSNLTFFSSLFQIVGVDYVYFIQKNSLDRRKRTLKIQAYNESFSSRIVINEHCNYSVSDHIFRYLP